VNVPVLLIHGRDDTVVPFEQSEVMVDAMATAAFLKANNPPN
jgi:dipeptidyl aminopeptidase/acylaminoacyl peptidase